MALENREETEACCLMVKQDRKRTPEKQRLKGIEPSPGAWEATVLPLHHSRESLLANSIH